MSGALALALALARAEGREPAAAAAADGSGAHACGCAVPGRGAQERAAAGGTCSATSEASAPPAAAAPRPYAAPLVLIPGGSFYMGTDRPGVPGDGEEPARRVCVSGFRIGEAEVSNREWAGFAAETGHVSDAERFNWSFVFERHATRFAEAAATASAAATPWWIRVEGASWRRPYGPGSDVLRGSALPTGVSRALPGEPPEEAQPADLLDHPAVHISWADAAAYCAHAYPRGRLPTEAEWERAAGRGAPRQGGTEAERAEDVACERCEYPWGDALVPAGGAHRANVWQGKFPGSPASGQRARDGYAATAPVRAMGPQNGYGLYNMLGNAWEWVEDTWATEHASYWPTLPPRDPKGPPVPPGARGAPTERVKKGGSFLCHRSYCFRYRISGRTHSTSDSSASNLGFRCAQGLSDAEQAAEEVEGDVCARGAGG